MNVFEVKLTRQAEEQIREIAWGIAVECQNPDAANNLMDVENAAVQVTGVCYEKRDQKKFLNRMKMTDQS